MEIIRDSNVNELAHQFWERQARKTQNGKDVLAKIEAGEDAYRLLKEKHPYKLPTDLNKVVKVAFLNRFEVGALIMRKDALDANNEWARTREIIDGWGRLLPFEALLQEGYEFHPVETFVCVPSDFVFKS